MASIDEIPNAPINPAPTSTVDEVDMSGTAPSQPQSTQDLSSTAAVETSSTSLDPQPGAAQPLSQPESGISSVAQFLPSDANTDQPTPPPSQPLATGEADVKVDTVMTDAPSDSVAPVSSEQDSANAEPAHALVNGAQDASPDSTIAAETVVEATILPTTEGSSDPADASKAVPVQPEDVKLPSAPVTTESAVDLKFEHEVPDRTMTDAQASNLTRPREEDETTDEPSAKRTKIESAPTHSAETKQPEQSPAVPPPATTAAPVSTTNGAPASTTSVAVTNGTASSHLPARSTYSSVPMTASQRKILEEKLKNTKKVKSALAFLHPVDPVALNIPNYPQVIKNPMDLGTIEQKLKKEQYASLEAFVGDFELMVNNCFTFNGPAHVISVSAQNLRAYFLKQMDSVPTGDAAMKPPKALKKSSPVAKPAPRRESRASFGPVAQSPPNPGETFALLPGGTPQIRRDSTAGRPKRAVVPPAPRDLPYSGIKPKRKENQVGLKFCEHVLDKLRGAEYDQLTMYFREPVDPVALNIPTYYSVIKRPMDLQTMTNKLKNGQYATANEFKEDFELIVDNCLKFNPPGNFVHDKGGELKKVFHGLWKEKAKWEKANQPQSQRASSASDVGSDSDESDEEDDGDDEKEATIAQLKDQLAAMQNMLGNLTGANKRASPKAAGKKKNKTSTKSKKASAPARAPAAKNKSKKQRLVTYDEKQEISNATESMTAEQIERLTQIITENVSKYKDMSGDDVELEIDDLPNDVQHKLLKYVRSIFPRARESPEEMANVDDDYEPERNSRAGNGRKKHKPMKKHEQEARIAQLKGAMQQMQGGLGQTPGNPTSAPTANDSSDEDDDSESSEEE